MVRAVASRVIPKARISRAAARESAAETARMEQLASNADAPQTVGRIPSRAGANFRDAKVGLRPMGNSRRIFLMNPHLEAEDMEGLAHRIHALSNNESINSVLIATDDQDDSELDCLPRFVTNLQGLSDAGTMGSGFLGGLDWDPAPGSTWHVSGGYDPLKVMWENDQPKKPTEEDASYLLNSLRQLAMATKGEEGSENPTRVPVITVPHGIVTDGGYAFCMGGYVLATRQTSFRILNPSRGLSLDPIGLSFILPRLGWENEQRSSKYPGCGLLMALAGYEANCFDMVETGLATHLLSGGAAEALPLLEYQLASIPPWNQQGLVKKARRFYGQIHRRDANRSFRNVNIAQAIEELSEHSCHTHSSIPYDFTIANNEDNDPALDTSQVPWEEAGFYSSDLVDISATFDKIFQQESSVEGIIEGLKEVQGKAKNTDNDDLEENGRIAGELVERMEAQSPLSLRVTYQLLKMGRKSNATIEQCMERELQAQKNMFQQPDVAAWAEHVHKSGGSTAGDSVPSFHLWKHKSVAEVTTEEVDAIIRE